jgi:hypothetical protein
MDSITDQEWQAVLEKLQVKFGQDLQMEGILFLIGVQELGKGYQKFGKDQKLDVLHIAISTLLEPYGYYDFVGRDKDGWPHWTRNEKLPALKPMQQELLMKQSIKDYFSDVFIE